MNDGGYRAPALETLSWGLASLCLVLQIVLCFFLINQEGSAWLRWLSWPVFALSAVLGWLPMATLRRHGGVAEGTSYIGTTSLVTAGIYGIVRHPQYLAFMLLNLAMAMLAQRWPITLLGAISAFFTLVGVIPGADREAMSKFGQDYASYAARVPAINLVSGLWRRLREGD